MSTYERVKKLAAARKMSIAELERVLNLSNGMVSKWSKSKPNSEPLSKVADYFDVSTDYLLGRTDLPHGGLTKEQREMTIEEAINSVMSHGGKEVTDNDREVLKRIAEAYLEGKYE
ncbi:transcriptional regulator [Enterococcus faecalis]|uniref:helix-turn-helix domain-containing protein n=1 Tax=Enterococcus faecalis TaxID=1351 RepID=UPI00100EB44A|nr:helix-turn-helix transcriptional regulator [Enterococcus faecalis]RXV42213.1 transcriptional regulator [Enterococcus faecalis]